MPEAMPVDRGTRSEAPTTDTTELDREAATDLLALLDADHTLAILEAVRDAPKRVRTLEATCEASRATIYRRLNSLEDAGLVDSELVLDDDGHHHTAFEATLQSLSVDMTGGDLTVTVETDAPEPVSRHAGRPTATTARHGD